MTRLQRDLRDVSRGGSSTWEFANFVEVGGEFVLHETIFCYSERDAENWSVSHVEKIWMHEHSLWISNWIIKCC